MAKSNNLTYFTRNSFAKENNSDKKSDEEEEGLEPRSDLEAGKQLPFIYGDVPPEMLSEPLEELDPYYRDKNTFLVLNERKTIFRFNATPALYILPPFNLIRRLSIKVLVNFLFNMFIMGTFVINCLFLTMCTSPTWTKALKLPFIGLYTFEILVQILARGFVIGPFTFLNDPWNLFDIPILTMAYLSIFVSPVNDSALGIFSLLRIMKSVSLNIGPRSVVGTLTQSVKMFSQTVILIIFCLSVFAVMGMQLFMGKLKQKCQRWPRGEGNITEIPWDSEDYFYYLEGQKDALLCGNNTYSGECPDGYMCVKAGMNPDHNHTSFDNFSWAMLTLFRLMTLDYWENLYQQTLRAAGKIYVIFFMVIILFCSFYLMTLILAVVIMAYEKQNRITINEAKKIEIKYQALLYQQKREENTQEMVAEGIAEDERVIDQNIGLPENSSELSQCSSKNDNGRMDQRKKKNQEDQPNREEIEIDLKLHRFETEEYIRKKLCPCGIKKQRVTNKRKLHSPQQGRTAKTNQKEGQINSCCVSLDILDDPTIRQRAMRKTNVLNKMETLDESRPICTNWWHRFGNTDTIWSCSPPLLKCKGFVYTIVTDPFFELAIAICVIINVIFMAMDHYPMTEKFYDMLSTGNLVFTGIYTTEMFLKIIAIQPCNYFQRGWNILDSFIVLLALIELYIAKIYALSFFKSFRLLRVFKLTKYWPTFEKLIKITAYSVEALRGLISVVFITLFIFAVVGMKQFGENCQEYFCNPGVDCPFPRWHMHDFLHAFLMTFRVFCGEWIEPMLECMDRASQSKCLVFFVMMVLIGKMLLLILSVALLSSFSSENFAAIQVSPESNNLQLATERIQKGIHYVKRSLLDLIAKVFSKKQMISNDIKREEHLNMEKNNVTFNHIVNDMNENFQNYKDSIQSTGISLEQYSKNKSDSPSLIPNPSFLGPAAIAFGESDFKDVYDKEFRNEMDTESSKENLRTTSSSEDSMVPILASGEGEQAVDKPLKSDEPGACFTYGCIRRFPYCEANVKSKKGKIWWNLRKTCYRTVKHGCFEISIVLIIFLSCAALIFEDIYIEKRKTIKIILEYGDMIFTYIFILEMLLKWMAYGYKIYFSNVWCWLEFLVVNVSLVSLVANYLGYSTLATLKSLRMLRILSVYEEVRVVLHIFLKAVPSILKALLVCYMCWLFFSLMGVNLFAGKFYKCVNITTGERLSRTIVTNFSECMMLISSRGDVQWKNGKANFDNVRNGYLSLLQLATFQGWLDIINAAADTVDVGSQPEYESNLYVYLYFVNFIIFGLFFPLVFFISVVINHFKQQIKISVFMTENQKKYCNLIKKLGHGKPPNPIPRPRNKFQGYVFDLVTKDAFEITVIIFILLNMVTMMVETDTQSPYTSNILYQINLVFIGLFVGECVLKLIGLRQYYFTIVWNIFDFVVVHLSIMVVLQPHLMDKYLLNYAEVQVIRLIRCGRVLTFTKGTKGIGLLIHALVLSLPTLLNIVLLLLLVMFIYAIIGMSHFAYVKKDAGINDMFNFETFSNSILCLFQITTFAGWDGLLAPILNKGPPDCDPEKIHPGSSVKGDCGNPSLGILYFVSYIIISFLVLVNMFIVVILEICSVVTAENAQPLNEEAFDNFYEVWKQFDPSATHFIDYSQLSEFAASLDPPLLIAKPNKIQLIAMDLPMVRGDRVFCADVLIAFIKHIVGEGEAFESIHLPIRKQFLSSCLFQIAYEPVTTTLKRKQEEVSALVIQRAFRQFCLRQNVLGTYNIKGEDREKLTVKEDVVFEKVQEISPLEKVGDLSLSPTSIPLDSGIEQDREKHETN